MSLFVSTVSNDVVVPELGITIVHITIDFEIDAQFSALEIKNATSLTTAILNGSLTWSKTSGGPQELASDYDPDYVQIDQENTGTGAIDDRAVTFKGLRLKSGKALAGDFSGSPKRATVTFPTPFPTNNYTVNITGTDVRVWTIESKTTSSFVINANANAAIISLVGWQAQLDGEVG